MMFRPTGWGRYIDVVFLTGWLAIWSIGEAVGLTLAITTIVSRVAASLGIALPDFFPKVSEPGAASFVVLFGIVWLTLWTVGGIAAATHLLRNLAGADRVSLSADALLIERRAGPFHRVRRVPREAIRRLRMRARDRAVVVDANAGGIEITTFGTAPQREALHARLHRELALPDADALRHLERQAPPPDWEVEPLGADLSLARPTRRTRRQQAIVTWSVTAVISLGWLATLRKMSSPRASFGAAFDVSAWGALGLSALLAAGAIWLTWGRTEWLVRPDRLAHRRRFGSWTRERVFEHGTFTITRTVDSDGDDRYTLRVETPDGRRKKIATSLYEEYDLVWLAEWLAGQTRFPLHRVF